MYNEETTRYYIGDDVSEEKTCWTRKTRFQMALILVLFVVVPILFILLTVYFASLTVWSQSEKCENMCKAIGNAELRGMLEAIGPPTYSYKVPFPYTKIPVPSDIPIRQGSFSILPAIEVYDDKNSPISKTPEEKTSTALKKITSQVPEVTTSKAAEEITSEAPGKITSEALGNITSKAAEKITSDAPQKTTSKAFEKITSEAPEEKTSKASDKITSQISDKITSQISEKTTSKASIKITSKAPEKITSKVPEKITSKASEKITSKAPEEITSKAPEKITSKAPEKITSKAPQKITSKAPQKITSKPPQKITSKAPEKITSEAPKKIISKAPEKITSKASKETTAVGGTTTKPNSLKKRRYFSCPRTQYPFIAVLLENLYSDSVDDYFVRCTLAVMSYVWVLTTKQCINNEPSQKFSIRINSDYWSKDGTIKKIEQMIFYKDFVALKMDDDKSNQCLNTLMISGKFNQKFNTFLWKNILDEFLENRKKFEKIIATNVELEGKFLCGICKGFVSPLVDLSESYLVGFQENGQRIYDVTDMEIRDWLSQVIKV